MYSLLTVDNKKITKAKGAKIFFKKHVRRRQFIDV